MNPIQRGQASAAILENPLVKEAFEVIESALNDSWRTSPDAQVREEIYYTLKGLDRFRLVFETAIQSGSAELALQEKYGE